MKRPTGLKVYPSLLSGSSVVDILKEQECQNPSQQLFRLFGQFGGKKSQPPSPWMLRWGERMKDMGLYSEKPNQYRLCDWIGEHSGQFKWHTDNNRHGEQILVICLTGNRVIGFRPRSKKGVFELELGVGDGSMIQGSARWSWEHCVLPRGEKKSGGKSFVMSYKRQK